MPPFKIRSLSIRRLAYKNMECDGHVADYRLFLSVLIGVVVGFSFAYIMFVCTGFTREVPFQILRRSVLKKHNYGNNECQEIDKTFGEELAKNVRVLCWVLTQPENHETKAIHAKATWGKRCTKLLFISSKEDKTLPALNPNILNEGRPFLWGKTRAAFLYIYENHRDDADWFLKADDDTYVIVDNLRYMLAEYDSQDPIYFGCQLKHFTPQGYMSGGAGYVLSREALHRFVMRAIPEPTLCRTVDIGIEDVEMGKCLYNVGVRAMDSRDEKKRGRFLPFKPEHHLFNVNKSGWLWEQALYPPFAESCCSDYAVTFHSIHPGMMYVFEYFLYHLRPYGFHHNSGPEPRLLRRYQDNSVIDYSEPV